MSTNKLPAWCLKEAPDSYDPEALIVKSSEFKTAACLACQTTISGKTEEDLANNLKGHLQVHVAKRGYYWCKTCQVNLGTHTQMNTINDHAKGKRHDKKRKRQVCRTCCSFDPLTSHPKDHHVIDLPKADNGPEDVRPKQAPAGAMQKASSSGIASLILALGQYLDQDQDKLVVNLPCTSCYKQEDFPTKPTEHDCRVCLYEGRNPNKAVVATINPPNSFMERPIQPPSVISKGNLKELSEEEQECYDIPSARRGSTANCTLDKESWEEYASENSKLRRINLVDTPKGKSVQKGDESADEEVFVDSLSEKSEEEKQSLEKGATPAQETNIATETEPNE